MSEEKNDQVQGQEGLDVQKYLSAIEELKRSSVPIEQYNQAKKESAELLQAILDGRTASASKQEEQPEVDVRKLIRDTFQEYSDLSDLQLVKNILQIRDISMQNNGSDPFVPAGSQYRPTLEDVSKAKNLAECLQHCVDVSDGDNTVFIRELARITR